MHARPYTDVFNDNVVKCSSIMSNNIPEFSFALPPILITIGMM